MMTVAELRKEAGQESTDAYLAWLEGEVIFLRKRRDDLIASNNDELMRRRKSDAALRQIGALARLLD